MKPDGNPRKWLEFLDDEDLGFLKRFLLASGSLKEVAKNYGVSYPTVRLRIDRLIQKVKIHDEAGIDDPYEASLRALAAEGRFDAATLKLLLRNYSQTKESPASEPDSSNESPETEIETLPGDPATT